MRKEYDSWAEDIQKIRENHDDITWIKNKAVQRTGAFISSLIYRESGISYGNQDWDNLLILDGCRADVFEDVVDLSIFDNYRRVKSNASLTAEWVKKNFSQKNFGDTVYIASNPFISMHAGHRFHNIVELWKDEFSSEHHTVLPESVTDSALSNYKPDKRLVAHYMQPHWPFIGSDLDFTPANSMDIIGRGNDAEDEYHNPFKALRNGIISVEEVWISYRNNLKRALPSVIELAEELEGRTVVTSDHGNLFGEKLYPWLPIKFYGHPTRGLRIPELVDVPWAVIDGTRRDTTTEYVAEMEKNDQEVIDDRLKHLGYK